MKQAKIHPAVTVCDHPLLQHHLSILRNKHAQSDVFRATISRVAQFVLQEATRHLPLSTHGIETPLTQTEVNHLSPDIPIIGAPILRAGLMMSDVMLNLIPTASIYHIGLYRDEQTFTPVTYYNKLPTKMDYSDARVFILDPMLATGGSISAALDILCQLGVKQNHITVACIIAVPEGIRVLTEGYPDIKIVTGALDERLNERAYIVPGLGDAGDRAFGTL